MVRLIERSCQVSSTVRRCATGRVLEVLDHGVRAWEDQPLMSVVGPTHDVRWAAVLAAHLQDLAVSPGVADVGAMHNEPVTD